MSGKLEEIKTLSARIRVILESYPAARDNDRLIYSHLLTSWLHTAGVNPYKITGARLIDFLSRGGKGVPNIGSVVRARALLQEQNPELRGKYYGERRRLGDETRDEFNQLRLDLQRFNPHLEQLRPVLCYCGGIPVVHFDAPYVWIACEHCGEKSNRYQTADEAAQDWNSYVKSLDSLHQKHVTN